MTRPHLSLIAAVARNGVIGRDNTLPWRLPEDLKRFRTLTMGHPVIMGRRTWESLGRPLPGRRNLVITRDPAYAAPGAEVFASIEAALAACAGADEAFVIGGAHVYVQALPLADRLHLTEIAADIPGDTHFPGIDPSQWRETVRVHGAGEPGLPYDFVEYERISPR